MSPPQDSRDYVYHATPPPDTKPGLARHPQFPSYTATVTHVLLTLTHELGLGIIPGARLTCRSFLFSGRLMAGPVKEGGPEGTDDREETPHPLTKEHIEGHVSVLKSLIKSHNQKNKGDPIRLDFESEDTEVQDLGIAIGKEVTDEDLGKPFKEARRTPLTRRIIEFAGSEYKMPANIKLYDDTTDPEDHLSRFASAADLEEYFIMGVPEVMKISSFMDAVKSPELAKCFSNKVPITVNEIMERLDDFVRSEEAYARTELSRGELGEAHRKTSLVFNRRDIRSPRNSHPGETQRRNLSHKNTATFASSTSHVEPIKVRKHRSVLRLSPGKEALHKRLYPAQKIVRDGIKVWQIESLGEGCAAERKRTPGQRGSPTSEAISSEDVFEEPLIVEAKVKGYLNKGQVEGNLNGLGRVCWRNTKTIRKDRAGGRPGLKTLRATPFTIHSMMKFPTPKGVATLVTRTIIIAEWFTFQRLVDSTFQCQIGRNLEAYMDDMVIKSKDEKMLLADIAETFDNLKKINMKLNPKKCSFRVEEGKFLGNIVTSEGIRANPRKTKALAVSEEAVSAVLLTDKKGRQCHVQYVSRKLNENERNYAPMEKLTLSLIHVTRRLRRYFEAHPVKVITEQPIRNILNNSETSIKLEKYAVKLGAYNITYIPRNAVKGQVLADFLSKAPEGEKEELYFQMPEVPLEKDDIESWTLFTDEASSPKGSGAGLVLIGPRGIEYTYALRLTFPSTNNEAEYEALLAGLRIARQMNISNIEVKVDSKLVANQINRNY
nr:reverse transcriptase domain-containing protein [Tanacetum cinerariifolium]